jgi:hypothetical protein
VIRKIVQHPKFPDVGALLLLAVEIRTQKAVGEINSKVNDAIFSWLRKLLI